MIKGEGDYPAHSEAQLVDKLRHRIYRLERSQSILMERIMRVVEASKTEDDFLLEDTIYDAEITVVEMREDKHEQ